MFRLLVLSGKGGTGKTTVSSALIKLSDAKAYADCDVDAPNLHLAVEHNGLKLQSDFNGMGKAWIDQNLCINCGICMNNCKFDAIEFNSTYAVDFYSCEGCSVCAATCPAGAIQMTPAVAGKLDLYKSDKIFSTARLNMGFGNSGLLVTEVKKNLDRYTKDSDFAVIDGSPGIGCPVIASISGVDMLLLVTEPTLSGISDMKRIIDTARGFYPEIIVCINKSDINTKNTEQIEMICRDMNIPVVGKIPYDPTVSVALNNGINITDFDCPASAKLKELYYNTFGLINKRIKENIE
ncbi:MAG: ATP-binding protein [Clostridia bacterium]|nr:ATP-binding protein [Clostridia bacterium]MBN2883355.1 ATP-binding protein [Clostridia bacterium]